MAFGVFSMFYSESQEHSQFIVRSTDSLWELCVRVCECTIVCLHLYLYAYVSHFDIFHGFRIMRGTESYLKRVSIGLDRLAMFTKYSV